MWQRGERYFWWLKRSIWIAKVWPICLCRYPVPHPLVPIAQNLRWHGSWAPWQHQTRWLALGLHHLQSLSANPIHERTSVSQQLLVWVPQPCKDHPSLIQAQVRLQSNRESLQRSYFLPDSNQDADWSFQVKRGSIHLTDGLGLLSDVRQCPICCFQRLQRLHVCWITTLLNWVYEVLGTWYIHITQRPLLDHWTV